MAFLGFGYSYGNPYTRPFEEPVEQFKINEGSIYSMLSNDFKVFQKVIDKSGLYKDLFNNNYGETFIFFAPPDKLLPREVKDNLLLLDRAEAKQLLDYHTISGAKVFLDGHILQTRGRYVMLGRKENVIYCPNGESRQEMRLCNDGSKVVNGIVYVIDKPIII